MWLLGRGESHRGRVRGAALAPPAIVSGHWREQPCGPNHGERRRQWIAPYVKGPRDKPLVLKDTVRVLRA